MNVVDIRSVSKYYGVKEVVKDVAFQIEKDEYLGIIELVKQLLLRRF